MTAQELQVALARRKFGALLDLPGIEAEALVRDDDGPCSFERQIDRWQVKLRALVTSQPLERIEVSYPADWWQAVRERFFPRRWLRRWPAQRVTVELRADRLYPRVAWPEEPGGIHLGVTRLHPDEEP